MSSYIVHPLSTREGTTQLGDRTTNSLHSWCRTRAKAVINCPAQPVQKAHTINMSAGTRSVGWALSDTGEGNENL